jgi:hypothetical protein
MTLGKRRRFAKGDDEDEETTAHRRKSPRIQEIRQFHTSQTIVLAAHCHLTDWLQSTNNTKNTYKE